VRVEITDTGTGIRAEHLDKIFDTFFTTKTDSARGVGLGLSVCYGFIKDHGGDIQVESRLASAPPLKSSCPWPPAWTPFLSFRQSTRI
jgi:signal transduction histidine kinase